MKFNFIQPKKKTKTVTKRYFIAINSTSLISCSNGIRNYIEEEGFTHLEILVDTKVKAMRITFLKEPTKDSYPILKNKNSNGIDQRRFVAHLVRKNLPVGRCMFDHIDEDAGFIFILDDTQTYGKGSKQKELPNQHPV